MPPSPERAQQPEQPQRPQQRKLSMYFASGRTSAGQQRGGDSCTSDLLAEFCSIGMAPALSSRPRSPLSRPFRVGSGSHDGWVCAACTLHNALGATRCAVCDALRGSTLASAATLAMQRMGHQPSEEAHQQRLPLRPLQHTSPKPLARTVAHEGRCAVAESPAVSDCIQGGSQRDGKLQENVVTNGLHWRVDEARERGDKTTVDGGLHRQGAQSTRGGPCARLLRSLADRRRTPPRGEVTPRRGREHAIATPSPLSSSGMRGVRGAIEGILPWHRGSHETIALSEGSPLAKGLSAKSPSTKDTPDCRRSPLSECSLLSNSSPLSESSPLSRNSPLPDGSPLSESSPILAAPQLSTEYSPKPMQSSPDHMRLDHTSPAQRDSDLPHEPDSGHERWQSHTAFSRVDRMENEWVCAACTLHNAPDATRCAVCDALRGSSLASAATLAMQRMGQLVVEAPPPQAKNKADAPKGRTGQPTLRGQTSITSFLRVW